MSHQKQRQIAWISLGLLLALFVCSLWITPDLYYHLFLGRQILETGPLQSPAGPILQQPGFVNLYWIGQVILFGCHALGGRFGVTLLLILLWLFAGGQWARTAGLFDRPQLGLPLALTGVLILQSRIEPRPELFSYAILALQIGWLDRWDVKEERLVSRSILFFLTTLLWTGMHGYFALAPLLVGARLLSSIAHRDDRDPPGRWMILWGATLAGTLLSPLGPRSWKGVFVLWRFLHEMRPELLEFASPTGRFLELWTIWLFWGFWLASAIVLIALLAKRKARLFALFLAAAGLYLSASAVRNIPLLLFLTAPLWRDRWGATTSPTRRDGRGARLVPVAVTLLAIGIGIWTVQGGLHRSLKSETRPGIGPAPEAYAFRAVDFLERARFHGTVFNDAADGGFLEFSLPQVRPYADSRYTDVEEVRTYFEALRDPRAFGDLDREIGFDAVLLKIVDSPALVRAFVTHPEWRLIRADLHRALFVRRRGEWASLPSETARLYNGEDLSLRVHGRAAIEWLRLLRDLGRRDLIRAALSDIGSAERIPSFVLQFALEHAVRTGDQAMRKEIERLRPRMIALREEDLEAVDRLLAAPLPTGNPAEEDSP